MPGPSTVSY